MKFGFQPRDAFNDDVLAMCPVFANGHNNMDIFMAPMTGTWMRGFHLKSMCWFVRLLGLWLGCYLRGIERLRLKLGGFQFV